MTLKHWLGVFKDFKKILLNTRMELILTTRRTNENFNYAMNKTAAGGNDKAKIDIFKIIWKIPHIIVDDTERLKRMKLIEKEKSLFIPFKSIGTYEYPELE